MPCAWGSRPCPEPVFETLGMLDYCYEHGAEVRYNREALLWAESQGIVGTAKEHDTLADFYEWCHLEGMRQHSEAVASVLRAYDKRNRKRWAKPHLKPTCSTCGKVRTLDPCRDCAPPKVLATYPGALSL